MKPHHWILIVLVLGLAYYWAKKNGKLPSFLNPVAVSATS